MSNSFNEKILNAVSDIATIVNNPFKDKWVSILGDSISTYEGYIPEGNSSYYPNDDDSIFFFQKFPILRKSGVFLRFIFQKAFNFALSSKNL